MLQGLFTKDDVVASVTRADLIAENQLHDVSEMAKEAGFKWPVALTSAAWEKFVAWNEEDQKQCYQDEEGRLWDVLFMCGFAMRENKQFCSTLVFPFYCLMRDGHSVEPIEVTAKVVASAGDDGEPVLTIMTTEEID